MAGRKPLLTPEVHKRIVDYTRSGAFAWVAAQACGITPQTFGNWMRWGEKGNPRYLSFFSEVRKAQAEARVLAENQVRKEQAFNWLRYGPGRERPGEPGWTESKEIDLRGGLTLTVVEQIVSAKPDSGDPPASGTGGVPAE